MEETRMVRSEMCHAKVWLKNEDNFLAMSRMTMVTDNQCNHHLFSTYTRYSVKCSHDLTLWL